MTNIEKRRRRGEGVTLLSSMKPENATQIIPKRNIYLSPKQIINTWRREKKITLKITVNDHQAETIYCIALAILSVKMRKNHRNKKTHLS